MSVYLVEPSVFYSGFESMAMRSPAGWLRFWGLFLCVRNNEGTKQ